MHTFMILISYRFTYAGAIYMCKSYVSVSVCDSTNEETYNIVSYRLLIIVTCARSKSPLVHHRVAADWKVTLDTHIVLSKHIFATENIISVIVACVTTL